MPRITRREFLKAAALTAALPAVPIGREKLREKVTAILEPQEAIPQLEWRRSACFICGQRCPIRVGVAPDGRIARVTFNTGPTGYYAACGRPQTIFEARSVEERIPGPLLRVGERGEGRFRRITWEEALDLLAQKLQEYKPWEIIVFAHQGPDVGLFKEFMKEVVGVPHITKHCDTCHTALDFAGWWLFGKLIGPSGYTPDYPNARMVVFMGRNPAEGIVATPWTKMFSEGASRGLRIIAFDVRESRLTSMAERYYIIPPATDLAIVLALINVVLEEKIYDQEYLAKYTNAPMLVYTDTMEPVGLHPHPQWEGKQTYTVIDADGRAKPKTEAAQPLLEWTGTLDGRPAATVLALLREAVSRYTPEWAEEMTGVPAGDIRWLARELAANAPRAFIDHGYKGTRYENEGMLFRAIITFNTLIGSIGRRGGIAWPRKVKFKTLKHIGIEGPGPQGDPLYRYWESQGVRFINKKCYSMLAIRSILEERPHRFRMAVIYNQNLLSHAQGSGRAAEALEKLDFVVVIDSTFNETVAYADLVLPVAMFFEETSPSLHSPSKTGTGQVTIVEKITDPPEGVDARPGWWIVAELGKRLDPASSDKYDMLARPRDLWRAQAEEAGIDYDRLLRDGVVEKWQEPLYDPLKGKHHATTTGEIELVNVEGLTLFREEIGSESSLNPLLTWVPPRWMREKRVPGPGEFVPVSIFHRMTATNMWIRFTRISQSSLSWDGLDGVVIHPERAGEIGVRDGDIVLVEGPGGSQKARVRVSSRVHPYVLLTAHATNPEPYAEFIVEDGAGMKRIVLGRGRLRGVNTNIVGDFRTLDHEGGRAAQNDFIVRLRRW